MSIQITKETIELCNANYITLDELIYLQTLYIEDDWGINIFPASIQKLTRLGFLGANEQLAPHGEDLLFSAFYGGDPNNSSNDTISFTEEFNEFWAAWPIDDKHGNFPRTRLIRSDVTTSKEKYTHLLASGENHEKILRTLRMEVEYRKSMSGENGLKYMKSPVKWLDTKAYNEVWEDSQEDTTDYGKELI